MACYARDPGESTWAASKLLNLGQSVHERSRAQALCPGNFQRVAAVPQTSREKLRPRPARNDEITSYLIRVQYGQRTFFRGVEQLAPEFVEQLWQSRRPPRLPLHPQLWLHLEPFLWFFQPCSPHRRKRGWRHPHSGTRETW